MAEAAKGATKNTTLFVGTLAAKVGLFATKADPAKALVFETAGPNGGALHLEKRAVEADPEIPAARPRNARMDALGAAEEAPPKTAGKVVDVPSEPVEGTFRNVLVEEGSTTVVEPCEVRRGVRREDGTFVDCTDHLAAIDERTKLERIEVVACIDATRVRRQRVLGARYVGGQDADAIDALALLYEALRRRREVAVVKYTLKSKQTLGVIEADSRTGTLVLLEVVWSEDWRSAPVKATAVGEAEASERRVGKMVDLLGAMHGTVDDLDVLRDDAIALREELMVRALAGEMDTSVAAVPEAVPDVDDALDAALAAVGAGKL